MNTATNHSQSQKYYILAKVAYAATLKAFESAKAKLALPEPTFEQMKGWSTEDFNNCLYFQQAQEIHDQLQVEKYRQLVITKEREMVTAVAASARLALGQRFESVECLFTQYFAGKLYSLESREEFIRLCMGLGTSR